VDWLLTRSGAVIAARLGELLGVSLNPIASFLSLTLADNGQIIHRELQPVCFTWDGNPLYSALFSIRA
jgi:hypothetical protein